MYAKPRRCAESGCHLAEKGTGFAPAVGPAGAKILVVGEALGRQEVLRGIPFVGDAGYVLDKCLNYAGITRSSIRIHNTVNCQPPNDWLDGAPWEEDAVRCCTPFLDATLNEDGIKVVVPVGGTAIRRLLDIDKRVWKTYKKPMECFHGTIHEDKYKRFWIVPGFHPSYIQRGNYNVMGALIHSLVMAKRIAEKGYDNPKPNLVVDPPLEWFAEWCQITIDKALEVQAGGGKLVWLAVDIETPEKGKTPDESEVEIDDPSYIITRINLATDLDPETGLTVPWNGPYISWVFKLLACSALRRSVWHQNYDIPRLRKNGAIIANPTYDMMDGWHMLQAAAPKGLGFVAPFHSKFKTAWKHLSSSEPGIYGAWDGVQTIQCTVGIEQELIRQGQWDAFERHGTLVDQYALKPAEDVGLLIETSKDKKKNIYWFQQLLERYRRLLNKQITKAIPEELQPLEPKNGYKNQPTLVDGSPDPVYFTVESTMDCYKCLACGKADVTAKHRCRERKNYTGEPLSFGEWPVVKWYKKGEFNPASPQQILSYIKHRGHKPGMAKKTHSESSDADTIERLEKQHKDPFYRYLLRLRKIDKVKGTYVDGVIKRLDKDNRIHTVFTNSPDTWRTSAQVFNSQNVISAGKREDLGLGEKFRSLIIPAKACVLVEADWSGIEAVEVGWFANCPQYIRLAKLSPHAFIATHMKEFKDKPADISWSDGELGEYLQWVKHNKIYKKLYNRCKRLVHSGSYGMTPLGLRLTYPDDFPTIKSAKEVQDVLFNLFPELRLWQKSVRKRAHEQKYLGGSEHPFRYKLYFWDVYKFKRCSLIEKIAREARGDVCMEIAGQWFAVYPGKDFKSCIAYYPQSTSAGILREAMLRLFMPESSYYIGDLFYGRTPLRSPIHDSLLLEVPEDVLDYALDRVYRAMAHPVIQQPCPDGWGVGEYLTAEQLNELEHLNLLNAPRSVMEKTRYLAIGVEMEKGKTWGSMEGISWRT